MPTFKDFEKVADLLEEQSRTLPDSQREIALRRAISTIYYGVFWELRERLIKKGLKISEKQPHRLISYLLQYALRLEEVAKLYKELKTLRQKADYEKSWIVKPKHLKRAKYLAKLILKEV